MSLIGNAANDFLWFYNLHQGNRNFVWTVVAVVALFLVLTALIRWDPQWLKPEELARMQTAFRDAENFVAGARHYYPSRRATLQAFYLLQEAREARSQGRFRTAYYRAQDARDLASTVSATEPSWAELRYRLTDPHLR